MNKKTTIIIVEDDLLSAEYLKEMLLKEGYEVPAIVESGEEAVHSCKVIEPDIVLMDIMLKGTLTGSEAALQIKQFCSRCKIIFVTAYADVEMVDYAVQSKAYAYLMKPYRKKEILATIKVALTHELNDSYDNLHVNRNGTVELVNGLVFNLLERRLYKEGKEVPLSEKKLRFIELLAENRNSTVSNEQICNVLWGEYKCDATLRSLIHRIRTATGYDMIENINGVGYKLLLRQ